MKPKHFWSWIWIFIGGLYFLVPLFATFRFSLQMKKGELSLLAYQKVFSDPKFWSTFFFSLEMAILTIVVSLVLLGKREDGTPRALAYSAEEQTLQEAGGAPGMALRILSNA